MIENAALQYEGKDLVWWGYNKTHEFLIDRETLEKTDINSLKLTENLAAKFGGVPKSSSNVQSVNVPAKVTFVSAQSSEPSTAVASWKSETERFLEGSERPSGVILMSVFASEIDTIDQYSVCVEKGELRKCEHFRNTNNNLRVFDNR